MSENAAPNPPPSLKHELRTPLNHIIGYCEMLIEEAQDRGLAELLPDLERIHSAGRKLLSVINDVCDPERLPVFQANPSLLDHDVRTPLNQIIGYAEILQEDARERGHASLVPDLDRIHSAARELLRRVVSHFSDSRDITAVSENDIPQSATTFFHKQRVEPAAPSSSLPGGRLLVVDDDEGNRIMLARRLARLGHEVTTASDGNEALSRLRQQPFDLLLLDIQMPGLNGYQVLEAMKQEPALAQVPVVVLSASDETSRVARCIEMGAEDYLSKPFDPVLLRARIGACLEKKQLRESERKAFAALQQSQKALCDELAEAATYVRSLLPPPLDDGPVRTAWRFLPSTQLGGDALGYHWLDERRFAVYVLDVCGHGVGAALLSVSVLNALRSRSVSNVDFADPGAVLSALNQVFPMERQNNMFFTLWYGVVSIDTRELTFACGGHPPAVVLDPASPSAVMLRVPGAIIGGFPEARYAIGKHKLAPGSRLYIFSDGVYELARASGVTVQLDEFVAELSKASAGPKLDEIMAWASAIRDGKGFEDDVSILELAVP